MNNFDTQNPYEKIWAKIMWNVTSSLFEFKCEEITTKNRLKRFFFRSSLCGKVGLSHAKPFIQYDIKNYAKKLPSALEMQHHKEQGSSSLRCLWTLNNIIGKQVSVCSSYKVQKKSVNFLIRKFQVDLISILYAKFVWEIDI